MVLVLSSEAADHTIKYGRVKAGTIVLKHGSESCSKLGN